MKGNVVCKPGSTPYDQEVRLLKLHACSLCFWIGDGETWEQAFNELSLLLLNSILIC